MSLVLLLSERRVLLYVSCLLGKAASLTPNVQHSKHLPKKKSGLLLLTIAFTLGASVCY